MDKIYACIDLKSFYASVECVERGLDPLNTNLVVADKERTEKTICLAVTPSLKEYGLSGRSRLFEVIAKVKEIMSKKNVTLLFVTHATATAKDFCERGIVMKKGRAIFDGPIDEAIEEYDKIIDKK